MAAMDANPRLKAKDAAHQYNAPYQRLLRRRRGIPPSNTRGGHNKKLNSVQDTALRDYIFMLYGCGTPANTDEVVLVANRLLYYSTGNPKETVSVRWTKAWIKRQSDYIETLKSKPLSAKRLALHIVEDIEGYFKAFKKCKDYWGIQDEDIYNFDETGFQIGVSSGEKALVPKDTLAVYTADPENKELITSVETINYGGRKVPPMIIFAGAYHLRRYFKIDLDGDITFARSSSGYSNEANGWDAPEAVELTEWRKALSKCDIPATDIALSYGQSLSVLFKRAIRHCAVHRHPRIPVKKVEEMVRDALLLSSTTRRPASYAAPILAQ